MKWDQRHSSLTGVLEERGRKWSATKLVCETGALVQHPLSFESRDPVNSNFVGLIIQDVTNHKHT